MDKNQLFERIKNKRSFLCVGLDTDINKIPRHLLDEDDPVFAFNRAIIEATADYCVAYKPNLAFYESMGITGLVSLLKTVRFLKGEFPDHLIIADAKRGDIGNTSTMYAHTFYDTFSFDAVTVAPYMGHDSVGPFFEYKGKWVIVLALTSNKGSYDFQFTTSADGERLFENVLRTVSQWGSTDNLMFVVGATQGEMFKDVRAIVPDHFLLVPGIGAQGGSLEEVCNYGMNSQCGLIVNSSRAIIYASDGTDFAECAAREAQKVQHQMELQLIAHNIIEAPEMPEPEA